MARMFEIRNRSAEFLIFQIEGKEDGVQVVCHDESVWCTQKTLTQLFDCSSDNIGLHLKPIYETGELAQEATTEKFSVVQAEGERQVNCKLKFCNLDAIISEGYCVNASAKNTLSLSLRNIASFRTSFSSPTSTVSTTII